MVRLDSRIDSQSTAHKYISLILYQYQKPEPLLYLLKHQTRTWCIFYLESEQPSSELNRDQIPTFLTKLENAVTESKSTVEMVCTVDPSKFVQVKWCVHMYLGKLLVRESSEYSSILKRFKALLR